MDLRQCKFGHIWGQANVKWGHSVLQTPALVLSNFQILNIFVAFFSGTVRPRRLKLVTHVNNGWMYHVYQNQTAAAYLFLYFFIFLSLQFSNIKNSVALLSGMSHRKLKLGSHMINGWMYRVYHSQAAAAFYSSLFSFFFLSNFQRLKFFITLFSGTVRPRYWKLVTHVDCGRMYGKFLFNSNTLAVRTPKFILKLLHKTFSFSSNSDFSMHSNF